MESWHRGLSEAGGSWDRLTATCGHVAMVVRLLIDLLTFRGWVGAKLSLTIKTSFQTRFLFAPVVRQWPKNGLCSFLRFGE